MPLIGLSSGCGAARKEPARPPLPALHLSPLTDSVAGAGLEWLVSLEPKVLASSPETSLALGELFPRKRFDDFKARHGLALESLDELVVAGYRGESVLAFARGFLDPKEIEAHFNARTLVDERHVDASGGIVHVRARRGEQPEHLLLLGTTAAGIERGKGDALRAAELFALGKLHRAKPALAADPLAPAARALGVFPARAFFPGPFDDEWARAGGGLLRTATAVAIGARPTPVAKGASLEVVLVVMGTFSDAEGAKARFGAAIDRLLASDLGHLLGTDQPAEPLRVEAIDGGLRGRIALQATPLFRGLYTATEATAEEIIRR
jgi:hypothetical protein